MPSELACVMSDSESDSAVRRRFLDGSVTSSFSLSWAGNELLVDDAAEAIWVWGDFSIPIHSSDSSSSEMCKFCWTSFSSSDEDFLDTAENFSLGADKSEPLSISWDKMRKKWIISWIIKPWISDRRKSEADNNGSRWCVKQIQLSWRQLKQYLTVFNTIADKRTGEWRLWLISPGFVPVWFGPRRRCCVSKQQHLL